MPSRVEELRQELVRRIASQVGAEQRRTTEVPGLTVHRRTAPTPPCSMTYEPSLILTAQGRKRVELGGKTYTHGGHVGLLTTSGLLNGIFGEGDDLHVARWESLKITDRFEETDESGVVTIRERERFTQALTLVYTNGTTAILKEGTNGHAECAPSNGHPAIHEDLAGHDD